MISRCIAWTLTGGMLILLSLQLAYGPRAPRYVVLYECSWDLQQYRFDWEQRVLDEMHEKRKNFVSEDCLSEFEVIAVLDWVRRLSESNKEDMKALYDVDEFGIPRNRVYKFEVRDYDKGEHRSGLLAVNALGEVREGEYVQSRVLNRDIWSRLRESFQPFMKWK